MKKYPYREMKIGERVRVNLPDLARVRSAVTFYKNKASPSKRMSFDVQKSKEDAGAISYDLVKVGGPVLKAEWQFGTYPKNRPAKRFQRQSVAFPLGELIEAGMGFSTAHQNIDRLRSAAKKYMKSNPDVILFVGFDHDKLHCFRVES